jgi:hypothetical protein
MTSKRGSLETSITFGLSDLSIVGFVFDADQSGQLYFARQEGTSTD